MESLSHNVTYAKSLQKKKELKKILNKREGA